VRTALHSTNRQRQSRPAVPLAEIAWRHRRCRDALADVAPTAGGLLVFSPRNLYYLAGTIASGVMWLPPGGRTGTPVPARAGAGAPRIAPRAGAPLPLLPGAAGILAGAGSPLCATAAAENGGLSWTLGEIVRVHLAGSTLVAGDRALAAAREVKSPWELERLRRGGATHGRALAQLLPARIRPGMSEREIAGELSAVLRELGNLGVPAMEASGSEAFLSLVAAGEHEGLRHTARGGHGDRLCGGVGAAAQRSIPAGTARANSGHRASPGDILPTPTGAGFGRMARWRS